MELKRTAIAILCASVMLSGCTSDADQEDLLDENAAPIVNAGGADSDAYKVGSATVAEIDLDNHRELSAVEQLMQSTEFSDPNNPLSKRTIYFEYDSSLVLEEFIVVLEAHANYLMSNPNQHITLEGHSDERGTREYNIALGEQRAKAVFKMLQLIGVMENQIDIVSYGEEKPAVQGHDDHALSLNRRVEIVYK
jgi:peptidoglycan-associated lipoprotein